MAEAERAIGRVVAGVRPGREDEGAGAGSCRPVGALVFIVRWGGKPVEGLEQRRDMI